MENQKVRSDIRNFEIYWADLSESGDCVQFGRRPVCVVCNAAGCAFSPVVGVIPISTKKNKRIPTHITLNGVLKKDSVLLPEQFRCINKSSLLGPPIAKLNEEQCREVSNAMIRQLGLLV